MSYIDLPLHGRHDCPGSGRFDPGADQEPGADFSTWRQPVLIVNGDHDAMVPTENSYVLEKKFPNSQLHIYPDAGHMSIFQNASDFAARTVKFLQS